MLLAALLALVLFAPAPALAGEQECDCERFLEPLEQMWRGWTPHHGRHARPPEGGRVGVEVQALSPQLREHFEVKGEGGVLVAGVQDGSPAGAAGLRAGDVILKADGEALSGPRDLVRVVRRFPDDKDLVLEISRAGKQRDLRLRPRPRPEPAFDASKWMPGYGDLEVRVRQLEERVRELEGP